jgi:RNA polymerase sigma-70 factor, ECF subfamily
MMRRVLVQLAREGATAKRGGQTIQLSFADAVDSGTDARLDDDLAMLDAELTNLEALSPRQARIVEMRFFSGLTFEEVAAVMDVSLSTVRREWRIARAWLRERLSSQK